MYNHDPRNNYMDRSERSPHKFSYSPATQKSEKNALSLVTKVINLNFFNTIPEFHVSQVDVATDSGDPMMNSGKNFSNLKSDDSESN